MGQIMSCCGIICSECDFYPEKCSGCSEIQGKPFWLAYTGESVCQQYLFFHPLSPRHLIVSTIISDYRSPFNLSTRTFRSASFSSSE